MYVCMPVCVYVFMYVFMYVCMYVCVFVCMYMYVYACYNSIFTKTLFFLRPNFTDDLDLIEHHSIIPLITIHCVCKYNIIHDKFRPLTMHVYERGAIDMYFKRSHA